MSNVEWSVDKVPEFVAKCEGGFYGKPSIHGELFHGEKCGKWIVISNWFRGDKGHSYHWYIAECECGKRRKKSIYQLKYGPNLGCNRCSQRKLDDINIGDKFYKWIVISHRPLKGFHYSYLCECVCGTRDIITQYNLVKGLSKACLSCCRSKPRIPDLVKGTMFGSWCVIEKDIFVKQTAQRYICKCNCGKIVSVQRTMLTGGKSRQCLSCSGKIKYRNLKNALNV